MKILEYFQESGKTFITLQWPDGTIFRNMFQGHILKEIAAHDTYISGTYMPRQIFEGEIIQDAENWDPNPQATRIEIVNAKELQAIVYDQYGAEMEVMVDWVVTGNGVKIENNVVVEEVVTEDTSYFIVARYGNLEERQERFLYPRPKEVEPSPDDAPITRKEYEELKQALEIALGGATDDTAR